MKITIFEYKQSGLTLLSAVMNSKVLNTMTAVLEYGKSEWGYQRKLKPTHVKDIVKYLNNDQYCLFPTSIILALDEKTYKELAKKKIADNVYEVDTNGLKLRTVDGQHRLQALKDSNKELDLNIVILIIPEKQRNIELDVFTTINSRAKRIPTDLAELARFKYLLLSDDKDFDHKNKIEYVAMKIVIDLNNTSEIWKDAVKIDIHSEKNHGIVGVSAFKKTIIELSRYIIEKNETEKTTEKTTENETENETENVKYIKILDSYADEIRALLEEAWKTCFQKWKYCFTINELNDSINYSKDFYIQKTLGISAINGLLKTLYTETKDTSATLDKFKEIIEKSQVKTSDWKAGGVMSGYSSESGFGKIRKFINNEIELK